MLIVKVVDSERHQHPVQNSLELKLVINGFK